MFQVMFGDLQWFLDLFRSLYPFIKKKRCPKS
uniref:Uncharacterized protein n=1 Tax=Rhizophora mucronata TaxID=61149 RepID=A0A2P2Q4I3_RHIMU